MKKVLSLLVAFVFLQCQTWAISGGPDYFQGRGGDPNLLVGTYSGVMISQGIKNATTPSINNNAATMGLFSLSIPNIGLAEGAALVFIRGTIFIGDIIGFADPEKSSFTGLLGGVSTYVITPAGGTGGTGGNLRVFAQGSVDAKIVPGGLTNFSGTGNVVGTSNAARVIGRAEVDTFASLDADDNPDITETNIFALDGFKQTNTPSSISIEFDSGA